MNKIDLEGKNAIVTGAARGIGFAIVQRLLASGARCSLWDIDRQALNAAESSLGAGDTVHTAPVDITDPVAVKSATDAVFTRFGAIDILINNAGIIEVGPLQHMGRDDFERAM